MPRLSLRIVRDESPSRQCPVSPCESSVTKPGASPIRPSAAFRHRRFANCREIRHRRFANCRAIRHRRFAKAGKNGRSDRFVTDDWREQTARGWSQDGGAGGGERAEPGQRCGWRRGAALESCRPRRRDASDSPLDYNHNMDHNPSEAPIDRTVSEMAEPVAPCSTRACAWCAQAVTIIARPGRPRLYCRQACRQRAYEHRHGFLHARTLLELPELPGQDAHMPPLDRPGVPDPVGGARWPGYERSATAFFARRYHAMRTSVRPEGDRRATLCGLLAQPSNGVRFDRLHPKSCRSCASIAASRPLARPVAPSNELARLRAVIEELDEERHDPASGLLWLHHHHRRSPSRPGQPSTSSGEPRPPTSRPRQDSNLRPAV